LANGQKPSANQPQTQREARAKPSANQPQTQREARAKPSANQPQTRATAIGWRRRRRRRSPGDGDGDRLATATAIAWRRRRRSPGDGDGDRLATATAIAWRRRRRSPGDGDGDRQATATAIAWRRRRRSPGDGDGDGDRQATATAIAWRRRRRSPGDGDGDRLATATAIAWRSRKSDYCACNIQPIAHNVIGRSAQTRHETRDTKGDPMQLFQKYAPTDFDGIIGQPKAVRKARLIIEREGFDRGAFWIDANGQNNSGLGKSTLARVIANQLADGFFITELDGASVDKRMVDRIQSEAQTASWNCDKRFKVWIVNEAHAISAGALDLFLTFLEALRPMSLLSLQLRANLTRDCSAMITDRL
jgi:hypothetical protein